MNSPLDQDIEEFRFTEQRNICKDNTKVDDLQKFGMFFSKILVAVYDETNYVQKSIDVTLITDGIKV